MPVLRLSDQRLRPERGSGLPRPPPICAPIHSFRSSFRRGHGRMTLRPLPELLAAARDDQYAVGYFEAWDSYSLEAVAAAAEAERSPVIIGCGGMMTDARWMLSFGIPALGSIACELAHQSSVPVALLLNEAKNMDQIHAAIGAGFSAVMLDTSELPRREAEAATRQVCELAHERHVAVEGELGRL